MTSPQDDFWALFDLDELPDFREPGDVSRFSVETRLNNQQAIRTLRSSGHLRLSGFGVFGHQANLEDVGQLTSAFQRLITALGSSILGAKQSISVRAQQYTKLRLDASPAPGSLILNFTPAVDPAEELRGKGEMIDYGPDQLIDKTFSELGLLLQAVESPDQEAGVASLLRGHGSKTAVSLRNFAAIAAASEFDLDVLWQQPRQPSLKMHFPANSARSLAKLIQGQRLDEEPVELSGVLTTVSSTGAWVMSDRVFGTVVFNASSLGGEPYSSFNPGLWVTVKAIMTTMEAPGQPPTRSFRAQAIHKRDDGDKAKNESQNY